MRPILPRLLLCVSLSGLGPVAAAAEARHMGPDGGGTQSETTTGSERIDEAEDANTTRRSQDAKSRQGASPRGGSASRGNAPRWHSFLPGMIR